MCLTEYFPSKAHITYIPQERLGVDKSVLESMNSSDHYVTCIMKYAALFPLLLCAVIGPRAVWLRLEALIRGMLQQLAMYASHSNSA